MAGAPVDFPALYLHNVHSWVTMKPTSRIYLPLNSLGHSKLVRFFILSLPLLFIPTVDVADIWQISRFTMNWGHRLYKLKVPFKWETLVFTIWHYLQMKIYSLFNEKCYISYRCVMFSKLNFFIYIKYDKFQSPVALLDLLF